MVVALLPLLSCKTRGDLRREEELKRLRAQIADERSSSDADGQELKMEVSRLSGLIEELFQQNRALQNDLEAMNNRLKEMEAAKSAPPPPPPAPKAVEKASYASGKALFDKGSFSEAIEVLESVLQSKPSLADKKNSLYLLAEAYFANKQYGQAAIEYSQFKKVSRRTIELRSASTGRQTVSRTWARRRKLRSFIKNCWTAFLRVPTHPVHAKS